MMRQKIKVACISTCFSENLIAIASNVEKCRYVTDFTLFISSIGLDAYEYLTGHLAD